MAPAAVLGSNGKLAHAEAVDVEAVKHERTTPRKLLIGCICFAVLSIAAAGVGVGIWAAGNRSRNKPTSEGLDAQVNPSSGAVAAQVNLSSTDLKAGYAFGNGTFIASDNATEKVNSSRANEDFVTGLGEYEGLCKSIFQGSIVKKGSLVPQPNGFIHTIISSYAGHHNLIIRPDDVWLAIVNQFSFFVNANSELLRSKFVAFEGRQEIKVKKGGAPSEHDFSLIAMEMVGLMDQYITDPALTEWILPNFTTSTLEDKAIGSILMMSTFKKYFKYVAEFLCGIPRITLAGEVEDWERILMRIPKLREYGKRTSLWADMLEVVLREFVAARKGQVNMEFWCRMMTSGPYGCASTYLSGWITTFAVFDGAGQWVGDSQVTEDTYSFGGVQFPSVDLDEIPPGYAVVDVLVNDNGYKYNTSMFAGHMGSTIVDAHTLAPQLLWSMCVQKDWKAIQKATDDSPMHGMAG